MIERSPENRMVIPPDLEHAEIPDGPGIFKRDAPRDWNNNDPKPGMEQESEETENDDESA